MRTIDWVVFVLFLAWVVWDGMRRARDVKDLDGYYAAGRSIPWWAAGLSIMATQASAVTVIGTTGQGHEKGMDFVQVYFGLPIALVLLCIFLVPLYRSRAILTPYEYLEERFGPAVRSLASLIFLMSRCLALGVVIYAPAVALSAMIGLETWQSVLVIGALATLYTVVGGVSAVIWTDVKQMSVIVLGLVLVLVVLLRDLLPHYSFAELLELSGAAGRLNALEVEPESSSLLPRTLDEFAAGLGQKSFWEEKYNLLAGVFGGLFLHLSYFGCDHSQAQRLLASKDVDESRRSLLLSAFAKVPMQALVLFLGVMMWMFHVVHGEPMLYKPEHLAAANEPDKVVAVEQLQQEFDTALQVRRQAMADLAAAGGPGSAPEAVLVRYQQSVVEVAEVRQQARKLVSGRFDAKGRPMDDADTNFIFCQFILDNLPPVLLALIVAAIFAAAMSSIDSTLNALSSATVVDFYRRFLRPDCSEAHALRVGRLTTLLWGLVATSTALFFAGGGSVIELINKIGSFFYGSLLGIFALALFVRRAGPVAGFCGLVAGMVSVLAVYWTLKVEYLWFNVVGCVGVLLVGWTVSRFEPRALRL